MRKFVTQKLFFIVASLLVVSGVFLAGMYIGFTRKPASEKIAGITNKETQIQGVDFEPFWKVWNMIDEKYPSAKDVNAQDRVYGAIKGLVDSLGDPYSVYFPPEDSKDFMDTINGSFEGIGMEVGMKDKVLTVIAPLKGTPADRAGIKSGDKILKINDTLTTDITVDKAVHMIRGPKGTTINLTIYRDGDKKPRDISVTRETIDIPISDTKLRDDGIFVATLYNFGVQSLLTMEKAMQEFNESGARNLIIDLRGNPGGYLEAAVGIASFYLPVGDVVVTENSGKEGQEPHIYRSKGYNIVDPKNIKMVVLIDKGSASASEILAGALREHGVAKLIGETTYGKGSVQEVLNVTKTTSLKLTIAKWFTPNGISISKKGIDPDIAVTVTEKDIEAGKDPVMERAVQYFKTGK